MRIKEICEITGKTREEVERMLDKVCFIGLERFRKRET